MAERDALSVCHCNAGYPCPRQCAFRRARSTFHRGCIWMEQALSALAVAECRIATARAGRCCHRAGRHARQPRPLLYAGRPDLRPLCFSHPSAGRGVFRPRHLPVCGADQAGTCRRPKPRRRMHCRRGLRHRCWRASSRKCRYDGVFADHDGHQPNGTALRRDQCRAAIWG